MSCKLKVVVSLLRIIATLLSLRPFKKKGLYGYCTCLPVKETIYFSWEVRLYRKILHFLNVHDSCTLSVCDEKLRNDLIKGTDYTPDYLGSIKNDGLQQNI